MRAARIHAYKKPLVIDDVPMPKPAAGQVVVKVEGSGFCHSDLHVIDGEIQILPRFPLTLGHENAGRVAAIGAGVATVKEGDPVAVYGGWGCGKCDYCIRGQEQVCSAPEWVGLSRWDGGYADYLLVPQERYLVKLTTIPPKEAAPLTDAALTPYRAVRKALKFIDPAHTVLVIGAGGLGQYGIQYLKMFTGSPVIAVDIAEPKRKLAKELGADFVFDGKDDQLSKKILDQTRGIGVCATFDFVGSDATLALATEATRSFGKITQVGLAGGTAKFQVMHNAKFEVTFEATLWGTLKELREVINLAESGRLRKETLDFVPLERIQEAYQKVKSGAVLGRVVVTPV